MCYNLPITEDTGDYMYFADLHIHSRFSRATSRDGDLPHLDLWARRKGIALVGTGDFTHPAWRAELADQLEPAEEGLYRLKDEYILPDDTAGEPQRPRFAITGEISTIYKKDGRTRKVHHVIILPSLEAAERLSARLAAVGNIRSDGRPILGLDSRDLLEIALEACPECVFIPAHIWTPHFSVFGALSGFERLEDCYGDLSPHIHALETGLSSDPPMNRRLSMLDKYHLVSNSDAHSPAKLGREANMLACEMSYPALKRALETGEGLLGTVEFYPEEGKYHLDGHRACRCCLTPDQTRELDGRCPVCGRKVTVGVLNRVETLADRAGETDSPATPFESLMPLPELLGDCIGASAESKRVQAAYFNLLKTAGSEFHILRELDVEAAARVAGAAVGEGLRRLRAGRVIRRAGYDGEYGVISLFAPGELAVFQGQTTFLAPQAAEASAPAFSPAPNIVEKETEAPAPSDSLNPEQAACVNTELPHVAVVAGPGTGKTKTLTARIAHLLETGVKPSSITAVTFTNQAARELRKRLEDQLGKRAVKGLTVGTFHGVCLRQIAKKPLLDPAQALRLAAEIAPEQPPKDVLQTISRQKCEGAPKDEVFAAYQAKLEELGARDMDDILLEALEADVTLEHLLVDECQDINAPQRRLMAKWSEQGRTLFAIGDPDQSIYGFRGASAACFSQLRESFPDLAVMGLTRNYRSTPEILSFARRVIEKNHGDRRALVPARPSGPDIRAGAAPDAATEGAWIAQEIMRMVGGMDMHETRSDQPARAFSDIAVLCRTRRQLERLELSLRRADIPCEIAGGDELLSDADVQAALQCLRALVSPDSALFAAGDEKTGALLEALRACGSASPEAAVRDYMRLSGVSSAGLERLAASAATHRELADFLQALLLGEEGDISRLSGKKTASGAVRLMTLHAAKGLEFPAVFLAGLEDGAFPLRRKGEIEDIEEERRLFFVGVTRAQEELILTCGGRPSPFFTEAPVKGRFTIRAKIRVEQTSFLD